MSFAHGKIQPPRPRRGLLLARPALEARLVDAIGSHRVVLVCAPAGYGKTALLVRVLDQLGAGQGVAWVSLDPGDDLLRLLECLLAAVEPFDPPWRVAPEGLIASALQGEQRGRQQAVDEIVNALDACELPHGVIVLDDLHHLDDEAGLHFLDRLLERLGPRWTLVLASRHEPALNLTRLHAAGELAALREAELRFTADESQALFAHSGLSADAVQALHRRTGGWAAGLRLALSGARGGGSTIDRQAFDFLAAEVLARIEPELRAFLLDTSVLHHLEAGRCEALTGDARAPRWLDEIERRGLFASVVDEASGTLRLHDLFRDALQHRLRVEQPDRWRELLRKAAALEDDPVRRHGLLLAAGCHEEAARGLLAIATALNVRGAAPSTMRLLAAFPAAFAAASAEVQHATGVAMLTLWRNQEAERHFAQAEALYAARGDVASARTMAARRAQMMVPLGRVQECAAILASLRDQELPQIEGRLIAATATMWLHLERGESRSVAPAFERLLDQLRSSTAVGEWSIIPPPRQTACPGMAAPMLRWGQGALAATGEEPLPLRALAQIALGWRAVWLGRLQDAAQLLDDAVGDAQWGGHEVIVHSHSLALRAMLALLAGDLPHAVQVARERIGQHPAGYGDWGLWHLTYFASRIAAAAGDVAALREWLQRLLALQATLADAADPRLHPVAGLHGALAELEGRRDDALRHWHGVLAHEEPADLFAAAGEVRVRLALLAHQAGAGAEAAALLRPLLERPDDGPRGAVFAAAALGTLALADWTGHLDPAAQATLRAWAAAVARPAPGAAPVAAAAVAAGTPLTARELEVVSLIARGQSNKLIARALDLSPHTVKRHIANALGKLDLSSRTQAAAWYHAHHYRA